MKYQPLTGDINSKLLSSQNVLVVMPANCGVDCLAAGLSLYLALKKAGKQTEICSESTLRVSESGLYGIGSVSNQLPSNGTGIWVLTIGGAVDQSGKSIFKTVDYAIEGSDLKLKFPIRPGHKFEPTQITPNFEGSNFELIFCIGAVSLESLGSIFANNQQIFNSAYIVNIDNSGANSQFGDAKIVDSAAATLTEMVSQIIFDLKLSVDQDIASNILFGIYAATGNLQGQVTAETFEVIASALRSGGQKPTQDIQVQSTLTPIEVQSSDQLQPNTSIDPVSESSFDFTKMYEPSTSQDFTVPPVVSTHSHETASHTHERESGSESTYSGNEVEEMVTPEDDWLTPKIYSGKSIG